MISHDEFGKLHLGQFIPDEEITHLKNWEFMGNVWLGEAIGFSEWLRLESDPNTLRSLALDLSEFPSEPCRRVLDVVDLPLKRGMSLKDIEEVLGNPIDVDEYISDRKSYSFRFQNGAAYDLSCTVLNEGGLIYLVIMVPN